ncbi:MAG: subclass B1 metallo-beta-lactamase [Saprospiraceae bacterium]|nr:subclass B1 metallo-beta-lactamase [Saprospiraceae bacterium]HRD80952.1 subclass B1 metallo-beta-lactamase [Saprospiraceae bacterium]
MRLSLLFLFWVALSGCSVPATSVRPLQTKLLKTEALAEGVFVHISYLDSEQFGFVPCNGMVYIRGGEAIVFDTPTDNAGSEKLIRWIEKHGKARIKAIVVNHFHADCLGGLAAFHKHGIPSYSNRLTIELARATGEPVLPQNGFDETLTLTCGDRSVINRFFGAGHTLDNIVSYLPAEKALFGGCLVKAMNANKGNLADADTARWSATIEQVQSAFPDVKHVIPGHGAAGGPELLDFTARLFRLEK